MTRAAPRCSRQSVNPPVDAPTSSAQRPEGSIPKASSAFASLTPPRDTYCGPSATSRDTSGATIWPGLSARRPSSPSRTSPAITAAAARERFSNSPRSTSSASSLDLAIGRRRLKRRGAVTQKTPWCDAIHTWPEAPGGSLEVRSAPPHIPASSAVGELPPHRYIHTHYSSLERPASPAGRSPFRGRLHPRGCESGMRGVQVPVSRPTKWRVGEETRTVAGNGEPERLTGQIGCSMVSLLLRQVHAALGDEGVQEVLLRTGVPYTAAF